MPSSRHPRSADFVALSSVSKEQAFMVRSLRPAFAAWPALMAALAYGIVEWWALSRSRAIDGMAVWRRAIIRR